MLSVELEEEDMAASKVHTLVRPPVHRPPLTSTRKAPAAAEDKKLFKCGRRKST